MGRPTPGLLLACLLMAVLGAHASDIKPFSLADVTLLHGSEQQQNMALNLNYLMMLEVDRLVSLQGA
jgi:hypothetical protein